MLFIQMLAVPEHQALADLPQGGAAPHHPYPPRLPQDVPVPAVQGALHQGEERQAPPGLGAVPGRGFRIRLIQIRIRIQHFRLNTDPDPAF
jgi:hypothetical protein